MADGPFVYEQSVEAGSTICINSTDPFLALIMNTWDSASVYTHEYTSKRIITHGPYSAGGEVGGFAFGNTQSSADIFVSARTTISFGVTNLDPTSNLRILSNHPDEFFSLTADPRESIAIQSNQKIQYFNSAPGVRVYAIDMDAVPSDHLLFTGRGTSVSYTGCTSFTRSTSTDTVELVTWQANSSDEFVSQRVDLSIQIPEFQPERYARIVTSGTRYSEIPVFDRSRLTAGQIAGIALGSTVGGVILVVLIVCGITLCRGRRRHTETAPDDYDEPSTA